MSEQIRRHILKLPHVTLGRRFGGEAFFYRNRFFCHFHPTRDHWFLETFVWNNVSDIVTKIPGVIPHPEYQNYGWVRLPLTSDKDTLAGIELIDLTYKYFRTTKRISLPREIFNQELVANVGKTVGHLDLKIKESKKRIQVLMQVHGVTDYDEADKILSRAALLLKAGPA